MSKSFTKISHFFTSQGDRLVFFTFTDNYDIFDTGKIRWQFYGQQNPRCVQFHNHRVERYHRKARTKVTTS